MLFDWRAPEAISGDRWQRELADAARFDPAAGARTLVMADQLPSLLCRSPVTWLIVPSNDADPLLALAVPRARNGRYKLLRFERERGNLSCAAKQHELTK